MLKRLRQRLVATNKQSTNSATDINQNFKDMYDNIRWACVCLCLAYLTEQENREQDGEERLHCFDCVGERNIYSSQAHVCQQVT